MTIEYLGNEDGVFRILCSSAFFPLWRMWSARRPEKSEVLVRFQKVGLLWVQNA